MTSPYLDRVRPPRETIQELIFARERQLARPIAALQRLRMERDLTFLRAELARIGGQERRATPSDGISNHGEFPSMSALESEIGSLAELPSHELRIAWRRFHRTEPPRCMPRDLLIRAIAYRLQERAEGGLAPATKRKLCNLVADLETKGTQAFDPGIALKPGARLVREWAGRTHTVIVLEDGFDYEGERYPSLTKIAARITGAHWSGPRFFGLGRTRTRPAGLAQAADD